MKFSSRRSTTLRLTDHYFYIITVMMLLAMFASRAPAGIPSPHAESLQLRIGALTEDPRAAGQALADPWLLAQFYERREFTPAWGSSAKLEQLLAAVNGSTRHGLNPEDYHATALAELYDAVQESAQESTRTLTRTLAAELDLLATDALVRLAMHLRFGKVDPEEIEPSWNLSRTMTASPLASIRSLLRADDLGAALEALAPDIDYYRALQHALENHRRMAAEGGWPRIESGETLRFGLRSERVVQVRARLKMSGDLLADAKADEPELFDEELEAAMKAFQERHGLDADGVIGRQTLAAMNVPVEARVDQLRLNLERVRWVFRDLEDRFLLVNIARFRVLLIEEGEITWSTRAVVGRPYRQTPAFKARMTYLELNPTWTVPPTILARDLLPEIRQDPATLQRKNMRVLDHLGRPVDPGTIDWATIPARGFPYVIRQQPGPLNALGRIKFMYPNRHHVYMHDTPARELFARSERTFSSGCIRLEQPFELARILLAGTQWDDAAIERALADGRTRVINLPQPISVLMVYGTAVPVGDVIHFAADVYGRDARLLPALNAPFRFIPPAGYTDAMLLEDAEMDLPPRL